MTATISRNIDMEELQKVQRFIGIGEQANDLRPFNADEFVQAFSTSETKSCFIMRITKNPVSA
jgi:hypothetical protein